MPNTKIPNDQKKFAEFCYGNMGSCKDGDDIECSKNLRRLGNAYFNLNFNLYLKFYFNNIFLYKK